MKIFVDYHHSGLLDSLHRLLEVRLGHELYRPIGMEWYTEGFWTIGHPYDNPEDTAIQYLRTGSIPTDGTAPLNSRPRYFDDQFQKLITLEEFKNTKFDIVIASYINHIVPYQTLCKMYQPEAKLIHQMGNDWKDALNYNFIKNIMASTSEFRVPKTINIVFYHQEFDTNLFTFKESQINKKISSFVNVARSFSQDWITFLEYQIAMPEWNFLSYGASNRDGNLDQIGVAEEMSNSMFGWHLKSGGDGFGHVIHQWFSSGRPPIVKLSQYEGKLAKDLMTDEKTCINIDGLTTSEGVKKIEWYSEPSRYFKLCRNAHRRFKRIVNYDKEQLLIEKFLGNLL